MTRSRAKQRKMLTISAPINRLVHMNIYALSATPFKQGLQAPQKAPLHPPHTLVEVMQQAKGNRTQSEELANNFIMPFA